MKNSSSDLPLHLTREDIEASGLKVGHLAKVLGVHRTTLSDLLSPSAKPRRPTPGAHALVVAWPHLPESVRKSLLAGEHLEGTVGSVMVRTRTNTAFDRWWRLLNAECRRHGQPEAGFGDATAEYEAGRSPQEAAANL
jgi:hypothetical protein|nr:hypothetical protein [Neorhizobium tomejilense]